MSKRMDQDERNATAIIHIIEALRVSDRDAAEGHLALAEKHALAVVNHGKSQWDPDYQQSTTVTPPPEKEE